MVESHFLDVGSGAVTCLGATSLRKRKASNSSFIDQEFLSFLKDTGVLNSCDEDPSIAELFKGAPGQQQQGLFGPEAMNDLPGVLSFQKAQQPAGEPILGETRDAVASQPSGLSSQLQQQAHQACASAFAHQQPQQNSNQQQPRFHRAVITCMPMPAPATRAAATAAEDDDDTNSAATLPMPSKRRRSDDEEVTSSPNDLVEVPSSTVVTTASGTVAAAAAATATSRGAPTSDAGAVSDQQQRQAALAASSSKTAAAADGSIVKAILVAKVLTKSDANSKRIILPRIAVEANLPQLSHAQVFNLSATDPHGASWPLVIKAWANGQNPKPVYVLEQVGEMLKQYKLTTGDAVAVMASEDGRFWLEWNTAAAKAAAARPTYSAFTFKNVQPQQQPAKASPAAPARSSGGKGAVIAAAKAAAAASEQPSAAQQQQQPAAAKVEQQQQQQQQRVPNAVPSLQSPTVKLEQQQQQQSSSGKQQQRPPCSTVMTAIPVTSMPMVTGTFIPTSPCQLLVMNSDNPFAAQLDDPLMAAQLPAAALMLKTRSDALFELHEPSAAAGAAAGGVGNAPEGEALLVPVAPEAGENGALHAGGFLLCPRTVGCTRPAGHQGWCLGHKGYKKRRV
ncbi:hypothetical protein COO60DRAFT_1699860 [Scenedesmus sp. NREL 46B-D3]|nr:hypothetical protein COO60DRAFT_1699860 [Scenedesmus sp. NREL 46B-D3]